MAHSSMRAEKLSQGGSSRGAGPSYARVRLPLEGQLIQGINGFECSFLDDLVEWSLIICKPLRSKVRFPHEVRT